MKFDMEGEKYVYTLEASRERVYFESLFKNERLLLFTRQWDESRKTYVIDQNGFGFLQQEAEKVRENASLISTAAQYGKDLAKKIKSIQTQSNVYFFGLRAMSHDEIYIASQFYAENPDLKLQMSDLLRQWDFGLTDVRLLKKIITLENGKQKERYFPFGIHCIKGINYELIFFDESTGTQCAYVLLSKYYLSCKKVAFLSSMN